MENDYIEEDNLNNRDIDNNNFEQEIETKEESNNFFLNQKRKPLKNVLDNESKNSNEVAHLKTINSFPNLKISLCKLLEFYLSDNNLINDKYLSKLLLNPNQGIDISIFLTFNKVKRLLNDLPQQKKKKITIEACEISKKIYFLKGKIYRYKKYQPNLINKYFIDDCTIYIENLPSYITHDIIYSIFKEYKINYISIPKYNNGQCKGYAFVTFSKKESVDIAIKKFNNSIPKEIINLNCKDVPPLNIITKREWIQKKEEFRKFKLDIQKGNQDKFLDCINNIQTLKENKLIKGTLVKLRDIDDDVSLEELKVFIKNFSMPSFIDIDRINKIAIIRFPIAVLAENFTKLFNGSIRKYFNNKEKELKVDIITGEEEDKYLEKVQELKEKFKEKKKKKIKSNNLTK